MKKTSAYKVKKAPTKKMKYQSGGRPKMPEPLPLPEYKPKKRPGMPEPLPLPEYKPKKRPGTPEPLPLPEYNPNYRKGIGLSDSDVAKLIKLAKDRGVLKEKNGGSPSKKMMNGGYSKKKMK